MIYVGCPGSSTVLYIEPGQLCSINTLLRGRKVRRIIPEFAMEKFMTQCKSFGLSTCDSDTCNPGNLCSVFDCPNVGAHAPVFFASSEFLNAHGIEHFFFFKELRWVLLRFLNLIVNVIREVLIRLTWQRILIGVS